MTNTIEIQTLNVRLPKEIVLWLDSLIERGIYKSRSEAIRDYSRKYLAAREKEVQDG
ncbi:ribbon-helix-helix domain-containing protein [Candidatus Woesearchaeota archaeon]|nr:ribbon-helix-helix domain-containing protein [Candidatus Woesearchaeota archaeon]